MLGPDEERQLTDLQARLSIAQGAAFDEIERAYCELVWSTDVADRTHARQLARQLFVGGLHVNFQVNELLGNDADRFTQQSTLPEQLATLRVPTLVIHGERDPRPARVARQLAEIIPTASYVELPRVGHLPWIEHPDLLRGVLRPFLERLSSQKSGKADA